MESELDVVVERAQIGVEQVKWQCRRGSLELDMMLNCFCDKVYATLSYRQQALFVELLQASDSDLQHWLVNAEVCDKAEWQDLILVIRHQYAMNVSK